MRLVTIDVTLQVHTFEHLFITSHLSHTVNGPCRCFRAMLSAFSPADETAVSCGDDMFWGVFVCHTSE